MEEDFTKLSDQELLEKRKKMKSAQTTNAAMIGLFVGITVYSAVKNGVGFFTFFPLFFVFLLVKNRINSKALDEEIKSRNL